MNSYDEVKLNVVRSLNSQILNKSFTKLYENDSELIPEYDYTPNIWENKWYNDNIIPGYSKGYCVWKYVYNDICAFLDSYGDIVYNYAQNNELLKDYLISSWAEVKDHRSDETKRIWRERYFNVISGYSKETTTDMTMNQKVRYLKFVFEKNQWSTDSGKWMEIGKLKFTDNTDDLAYPAKVFYDIENINRDSAANIDNILRGGMVGLQRLDSNKAASFTIDFGKQIYQLKKYPLWNMYVSSKDSKRPRGFTLYASTDGNDFVQLTQEKDLSKSVSPSGYYSGKVRIWNVKKIVQYLDPLFEYGEYDGSERTIQLFISTKDNNKDLLSNVESWQNLILSSQEEFDNFISTEVDLLFKDHIKNYHLDGILSNKTEIDELLLSRDLSNFNIDLIPTQVKIKEHDQYINADGFDYVIDFKCRNKRVDATTSGKYKYYIYQWYRLWNSGYLEHGGTIECPSLPVDSSFNDPKDYYISVDLSWGGVSAMYDYQESTGYEFGEVFQSLYYGSKKGDSRYQINEQVDATDKRLKNSRYSISLTPMQFSYNDDIVLTNEKFKDVSALLDRDYPSKCINNKVSSYITTEIHHIKNSSFCFTKSNTDTLSSNQTMQLYSYKTTGFTTMDRGKKSIDSLSIVITPTIIKYGSKPLTPAVTVIDTERS